MVDGFIGVSSILMACVVIAVDCRLGLLNNAIVWGDSVISVSTRRMDI